MQGTVVTKINWILQGERNYSVLPLLADLSQLNILLLVTFHSGDSGSRRRTGLNTAFIPVSKVHQFISLPRRSYPA